MRRRDSLLKVLFAASAALALTGPMPSTAAAERAGLRWATVADPRPGVVSRPLEIQLGRSGTTRVEMEEVRLEIQGFALNPGTTRGERIGTVDFYSDDVLFPGAAITTAGNGTYRLAAAGPAGRRAFPATVALDTGLDADGAPVAQPGSTVLSFRLPRAPGGAKLQQLALRFNVLDDTGAIDGGEPRRPSPAVGATNPTAPGTYDVRAWVRTRDGRVDDRSFPVDIEAGAPVRIRAHRLGSGPVRVGDPIRLRITASRTGVPTTVIVRDDWGFESSLMGPGSRSTQTYRPTEDDRGRTLRFSVEPDSGPPIRFAVRVER